MHKHTIDVAKDFSPRPFGRYRADGDRSAEVFRDDKLIPAIREHDCVCVNLGGTNYYGSSFLEETFGGLIRQGFTKDELDKKLDIVHDKLPSIVSEIKGYINTASKNQS